MVHRSTGGPGDLVSGSYQVIGARDSNSTKELNLTEELVEYDDLYFLIDSTANISRYLYCGHRYLGI